MVDTGKGETFRSLHDAHEILVLPGVWDAASARIFADQGFPALGTTSAGVAWSLGYSTGQHAPWPIFLEACRRIADAVNVPVSFDVEAGFGDTAESVCDRVGEAMDAGACGINLEDGIAGGTLRPPDLVVDSIRAIRELCARIRYPLFVNARTDVYLGGVPDATKRLDTAIARGRLYAEAGADGFFVPGISHGNDIRSLAEAVPLPLNVYALPGVPSSSELFRLGARRVSLGCGPIQAALARILTIARDVRHGGDWSSFTDHWMPYDQIMALSS